MDNRLANQIAERPVGTGEGWLEDFVKYAGIGETSPRMAYWVGVSTLAAVLRRKCYIDQDIFQWSPNFYILLVGAPGAIKKSTSIDIGMSLLSEVEGINRGPDIVTWQALIEYIGEVREEWPIADTGEVFEMSAVTIALSEFGSFFDPEDRNLVDNLTDLWDGKLGKIEKRTKTSGSDCLVNSWINIIAATTPKWLAKNFSESLVGGGLAGRFIYLYGEMSDKDIAYRARQIKPGGERAVDRVNLVNRLREMAQYSGEYKLTEQAYLWGEAWYAAQRRMLRGVGSESLEGGFLVRKQVHLHKLAMVISASRGKFPWIGIPELEEAERQLDGIEEDTKKVFGYVGQNRVARTAREIVEAVERFGQIERRILYRKYFFRTMSSGEFDDAVKSAIQAELIFEVDDVAHPMLCIRKDKL
jgi:hypothetical protein